MRIRIVHFLVQISHMEQIMGLMNTETVQIHAEACNVAIDISFLEVRKVYHC